jgi:hypothetical protein
MNPGLHEHGMRMTRRPSTRSWRPGAARRLGELRQEGHEEHGHLGVQDVDERALAETDQADIRAWPAGPSSAG